MYRTITSTVGINLLFKPSRGYFAEFLIHKDSNKKWDEVEKRIVLLLGGASSDKQKPDSVEKRLLIHNLLSAYAPVFESLLLSGAKKDAFREKCDSVLGEERVKKLLSSSSLIGASGSFFSIEVDKNEILEAASYLTSLR